MQPDYESLPVAPEISAFVRRYLYIETTVPIENSVKPAPTGFAFTGHVFSGKVVCTVDGEDMSSKSGLLFTCQVDNRDMEIRYSGLLGNILAEMYPTSIYRLFGIPLGDLHHLSHDWFDLLDPQYAKKLGQGVVEATTRDERKQAFDDVFRDLIADARPEVPKVDEAVRIIDQAAGRITVAEICYQLSMTERSLSRKFKHIVGLTPKFYARAVQLNNVLEMMQSNDPKLMTKLAHECGYFDQSHFIRTFQKFLPNNPGEFLDSDNHMFHLFMGRKAQEDAKD